MTDLDALPRLLRDDAAHVRTPPVATVLGRARRRQRRRAATTGLGVALLVLLAVTVLPGGAGSDVARLAGPGGEVEVAAGEDADGPWRVVWRAGDRCLLQLRPNGEGGACGLADPAELGEAQVRAVGPAEQRDTLVYGLAPDGAAEVLVTPSAGGEVVRVPTVASGDDLLFVARLAGSTGVSSLAALSGTGEVLAAFEGPALPPPFEPGQVAAEPHPDARGAVLVPWAVAAVGPDRRSVEVVAHAAAGDCTRPVDPQALDVLEGLRLVVHVDVPLGRPCPPGPEPIRYAIDLPRALEPAEQLLGECVVDDTADGVVCAQLRASLGD